MKSVSEIISVFSNSYERIEERCVEDFYSLTLFYSSKTLNDFLPARLDMAVPTRDVLSISIFDSNDEDSDVALCHNTSSGNWAEFVEEFENIDKSEMRLIKIHISKNTSGDCHSIYDYNLFCAYIGSCQPFSLIGLLSSLSNSTPHVFEWQDDQLPSFASSKFHFCGKGKKLTVSSSIKNISERERCVNKAKFLCSSTCIVDNMLPEDLTPIVREDDFLTKLFYKLSTLYTLSFLLDYSHVEKDTLSYKLNGFKSISGHLAFSQNIDAEITTIVTHIYEWGYQGGDIDDKILIIRNILSLNIDSSVFRIHPNTFDAILSNYKIYQKENVRQYLDLRNNIVRDIRKYQGSILNAIDNFEDTFKKISITLLSFFFISLILSILSFSLSSNRHIPDAVIFCCMAISVVSFVYYYKERNWLWERIGHLEKGFKESRKYFEDLLGKEELKSFFDDSGDDEKEDVKYRKKKINEFSKLWKWTNTIISVLLVVLLYLNHHRPLQEIIQYLQEILIELRNSSSSMAELTCLLYTGIV